VNRSVLLVQRVEFIGGHHRGVGAPVADLALDLVELGLGLQPHPLPAERHFPVAGHGQDGHQDLAGHVPAEDHHVSLVEGGGVEEFPPADLGAMDVRGEEDFHRGAPSLRLRNKSVIDFFG
jgi:hypothetical protein